MTPQTLQQVSYNPCRALTTFEFLQISIARQASGHGYTVVLCILAAVVLIPLSIIRASPNPVTGRGFGILTNIMYAVLLLNGQYVWPSPDGARAYWDLVRLALPQTCLQAVCCDSCPDDAIHGSCPPVWLVFCGALSHFVSGAVFERCLIESKSLQTVSARVLSASSMKCKRPQKCMSSAVLL